MAFLKRLPEDADMPLRQVSDALAERFFMLACCFGILGKCCASYTTQWRR